MKDIIILFGEMGSGKNYWGELLVNNMPGFTFFDGDTVATPEMIAKVSKFKPMNRDMIAAYIDVLIEQIEKRAQQSDKGLIVAQALYFDQDRKEIASYFECLGYNVSFYLISVPFFQNMRQLLSRPKGWRWALYWLMNKPFFQTATHKYSFLPKS